MAQIEVLKEGVTVGEDVINRERGALTNHQGFLDLRVKAITKAWGVPVPGRDSCGGEKENKEVRFYIGGKDGSQHGWEGLGLEIILKGGKDACVGSPRVLCERVRAIDTYCSSEKS